MYEKHYHDRHRFNGLVVAAVLIAAGAVLIGRNVGIIDYRLADILISWQMLLIVIGLVTFARNNYVGGAIIMGVGAFFLIPHITGMGHMWVRNFWPVIFIALGIALILRKRDYHEHWKHKWENAQATSYKSEDGYVTSDNSFGSVRQIVLDPVFKGALIGNSFGSTVLDLRHTSITPGETYIDVDCRFGGIEIYVPDSWTVKMAIRNSFSGNVDKRFHTMAPDSTRILVVRGTISFSGLEIKG